MATIASSNSNVINPQTVNEIMGGPKIGMREELGRQERLEVVNGQNIEDESLADPEHIIISDPEPYPESSDVCKWPITFSIMLEILILKAVVGTDAHLSRKEEIKENLTKALKICIDTAPPALFIGVSQPTGKILNDSFKKQISDHRTVVIRNDTANGMIEVRGNEKLYWIIYRLRWMRLRKTCGLKGTKGRSLMKD